MNKYTDYASIGLCWLGVAFIVVVTAPVHIPCALVGWIVTNVWGKKA